jgi:hypothetical protein
MSSPNLTAAAHQVEYISVAIRAAGGKLTILGLRRLRERLYLRELTLLRTMVGAEQVDDDTIAALAHCVTAISALDQLRGIPRDR